jgi:glycosyltransferase involved in cell wall biosynthesis
VPPKPVADQVSSRSRVLLAGKTSGLNLAFVCHEFPPAPHGGTGSSYRDLAQGLAAAGHRVTVVGVYDRELLRKLPADAPSPNLRVVRLHGLPAWFGYRFQMLGDRWRIKRWLECAHHGVPSAVIEASDYSGWLPWGGPDGVVTVVRMRGSNIFFDNELNRLGGVLEQGLERRCLLRATTLGAVSHYAARRTLDLCGQPSRPVTVIYNAVDTELFSPSESVPTEPGLIVFVNTLNPKKGIEQLLDAMNVVCAGRPQVRLAVVGQDTQPAVGGRSYVEQLRERVRPEFRDRVEFAGRQDRQTGVISYLRRAHVCCLPSHMETFGIAAVEAMAIGKPTIYSRTGPGPEVLEDGVSGLLCNPFDAGDISEKITRLLDDPALAARLGQGARARVLAMFNKNDWIGRNVDYYHQCLETR